MSRLPQPGSDNGTWGVILNDFLSVAHTATGTLVDGTVSNSTIVDGTIALTKLASSVQTSLGKADTALQSATKSTVGLGNVDNTSDVNKPISTATQTALDAKLTSASLDSSTAALIGTTSSTTTAINSKIATATAGTISVYILAPADPDPTSGSPAGLYFRRTT
ncbi:MAG: hypothetical protein JWN12_229 [Candidatus Saccharibacteria bacterium]|nr:hypothetical protein [Candidatus Saccharibacteria bacterium]